jgi:hypothetical protein
MHLYALNILNYALKKCSLKKIINYFLNNINYPLIFFYSYISYFYITIKKKKDFKHYLILFLSLHELHTHVRLGQ